MSPQGESTRVERKREQTDFEIGDLKRTPFLERRPRWFYQQWSAHLAVLALIALPFVTLAAGIAGALLDRPQLIDLAKSFISPELTWLATAAVGLYVGGRLLGRRGRR